MWFVNKFLGFLIPYGEKKTKQNKIKPALIRAGFELNAQTLEFIFQLLQTEKNYAREFFLKALIGNFFHNGLF